LNDEKFDTVTKLRESMNVLVQKKMRELEEREEQRKNRKKDPTLKQLEREVDEAIEEEMTLYIDEEILQKLQIIYDSQKHDIRDLEVDFHDLVEAIAEDEFFSEFMEKPVRISLEGKLETLEDLMNRMLTYHVSDFITWSQFVSFFSKRGKPRPN